MKQLLPGKHFRPNWRFDFEGRKGAANKDRILEFSYSIQYKARRREGTSELLNGILQRKERKEWGNIVPFSFLIPNIVPISFLIPNIVPILFHFHFSSQI